MFPIYERVGDARCFACLGPLRFFTLTGYPPGRGPYSGRCPAHGMGMTTWFDALRTGGVKLVQEQPR
jgi:hypothetical protein